MRASTPQTELELVWDGRAETERARKQPIPSARERERFSFIVKVNYARCRGESGSLILGARDLWAAFNAPGQRKAKRRHIMPWFAGMDANLHDDYPRLGV